MKNQIRLLDFELFYSSLQTQAGNAITGLRTNKNGTQIIMIFYDFG